jgi:hypothetical protein
VSKLFRNVPIVNFLEMSPIVVDVVVGIDAGDFSQTNNCGIGIPASGQCTITATFKPTTSGTRRAAVAVKDNAGGSPQSVPLSGTRI